MKAYMRGILCVMMGVMFVGCASNVQKRIPTGWTIPLSDMGIDGTVERLDEPHNWKVHQVSSFDTRGGNKDDKGAEQVWEGGAVLADLKGPGIVTRLWTRNPHGTLYIFVDDLEYPIIITPFQDLFSGELEYGTPSYSLFGQPFTNQGSGGFTSHLPIPYESACRIMATGINDSLGYQVTYIDLPANSPIQSFNLNLTVDDKMYFKQWEKNWNDTNFRLSNRKTEKVWRSRHKYVAGRNYQVVPLEGSGVITEIEMKIESFNEDIMDNVWIAIFFDGQEDPGVLAPFGDFFAASSKDVEDYDSQVLGRDNGRMWCRYPMPYRESAEIRFINNSENIADIEYFVTYRPGKVEHDNYFFARYNSTKTEAGKPYEVLSLKGKGHFVGASIAAANADSLIILEGDDSYSIDGESETYFHGTGNDDYFNAGWYFAEGASSNPTSGVALKKTKKPNGFSAFRSHFTEPVTFSKSFTFNLEHGPSNNRPGVDYSSVSYWYQNNRTPNLKTIAEIDGIPLTLEQTKMAKTK
jgi:hypothetical protein